MYAQLKQLKSNKHQRIVSNTVQKKAENTGPFRLKGSGDSNTGSVIQRASYLSNQANAIFSKNKKYGLLTTDTTDLYAKSTSTAPKPESRFAKGNSTYNDFIKKYRNSDSTIKKATYGTDCGQYARSLMNSGKGASFGTCTFKPIKGSLTPKIGSAYFIFPQNSKTNLSTSGLATTPWDVTSTAMKGATNFHVAHVVAKDGATDITSEVNAAYPGQTQPWFNFYGGGAKTFYEKFNIEYRSKDTAGKVVAPFIEEHLPK